MPIRATPAHKQRSISTTYTVAIARAQMKCYRDFTFSKYEMDKRRYQKFPISNTLRICVTEKDDSCNV